MRDDASTPRLLQLCGGYFASYVATGILVKYFQGKADLGFPGMSDMEFLVYSTFGGNLLCLLVVGAAGWWRLPTDANRARLLSVMIPSGVCTAVVVPTTTLIYSLPITVMVAMVIMRGSIIVVSRLVDAVQIRQGILQRRVYAEENVAVAFSLAAVATHLLFTEGQVKFTAGAAAILASYVAAYAVRIYLMNWFKNTNPGVGVDNRSYFAIEQIVASVVLAAALTSVLVAAPAEGALHGIAGAVTSAHASWLPAVGAGMIYGVVAFFSVFIFMFKGRSATFAGLVNRLTSLVAGTVATLLSALLLGASFPKAADWISLGFIFVAVGFLTRAEKRRASERVAQAAAK
ncbi:MAG: hypothetical protein ACOZNI_32045 [Myxococcota bacterium]